MLSNKEVIQTLPWKFHYIGEVIVITGNNNELSSCVIAYINPYGNKQGGKPDKCDILIAKTIVTECNKLYTKGEY